MKTESRRGRPRKFDEELTLDRIMKVFWQHGYSATSLDQISEATGLNRPSLYAAFGSKKDMYLKIVARFADKMQAHLTNAAMAASPGAKSRMKAIMAAAVDLYAGETELNGAPHGCLAISTLPAEAAMDRDIQNALAHLITRMDTSFAKVISSEIPATTSEKDARASAQHLALVLHGLSIRARAGEPATRLKKLAIEAVDKTLP